MKTGRLVVDRFHEKNHTTCSRGYDSDKYPNLLGTNTQRCEQLNSEFKRLKGMISYCKPESAWKIMTLYMATKNYYRACSEGKTLPVKWSLDNSGRVFNGPLGCSLCPFARTAHSTPLRSLCSASLCYARFSCSLCLRARSLTLLTPSKIVEFVNICLYCQRV